MTRPKTPRKPLTNQAGTVRALQDTDFAEALAFSALPEALQEGLLTLKKRGRPKSAAPKREVKLRLDPDILEAFKRTGAGWQTRINALLRTHMPK